MLDRRDGRELAGGSTESSAEGVGAPASFDEALLGDVASPAELAEQLRGRARDPEALLAAAVKRHGNTFVNEAFALLTPSAATPAATRTEVRGIDNDSAEHTPREPGMPGLHVEEAVQGAHAAITKAKAKLKHDPAFEQVSRRHGLTGRGGAPNTLKLPEAAVEALDELWKDSHRPDGSVQEQGGNLVRNYGGSYDFRRGEGHSTRQFEPDYDDVGWGQSLVGVVHTHPYANLDNEGASFSSSDLASISAEEETQTLNILRSGDMTFVVARTKEFDKLVARYEAANDSSGLYRAMYDCYENVFAATEGTYKEKVETSVRRVCAEFHLEYYEGRGGTLSRVAPGSP